MSNSSELIKQYSIEYEELIVLIREHEIKNEWTSKSYQTKTARCRWLQAELYKISCREPIHFN